MRKTSIEIQQKAFDLYMQGLTANKVGEMVGVSGNNVLNLVKRNGGKARTQTEAQRKHTLNEKVFSKITEESAYWIGFLMADGNIHCRVNTSALLTLALSICDYSHLEKFRKFLGASHKISVDEKRNRASFGVKSNKIAKSLAKYGVVSQKSLSAKCNKLQYNRHFWRGVIDGDGHIGVVKNRTYTYPKLDLIGSQELMRQFSDYIYRITGKQAKVSKHKSIWRISYLGKTVIQIVDHFYSNSTVYLDRKFLSAKIILSLGLSGETLTYRNTDCVVSESLSITVSV